MLPGSYTLTAALAGFQTATLTTIVETGATRQLAFALRIGSLDETITVTGAAPVVDTAQAQRSMSAGLARVAPSRSAREPFNTEAYDRIDDNRWTSPAHKPLSTFSIDVDTASYSNVRRFLQQGQLPPEDSVRIEELINYFPFDYAQPRDGMPFSVTTALAEAPWNPRHRLALVGLQGKRIEAGGTPPRNLVFLVDVSGSMQSPNKLPLVKSSLALLARNLTARDRLALVVYAGAAGVVLESTRGDDTATILEALGRLQAGGSTNGAQGLRLAYQTARDAFMPGGVNRVILATDGDFNVGVTNQAI